MTGLTAEGLRVSLAKREILKGVDIAIAPGEVTAVIGPNGCGKSTLLRALGRIVRPSAGQVRLDGEDLWRLDPRACARRVGFLPQTPETPEGLRVGPLVERGRTPHLGPLKPTSPADRAAVARAIEMTGLQGLEGRRVDRLSGGQRQRAWIALTLAQDTEILLLDEPTTFLDPPYQIEILRLVRRLNAETGRTIAMVLHDINLAIRYADRIIGVRDGRIEFATSPGETITAEMVEALFAMRVRLVPDPEGAAPIVVPL